MAAPKVIAFKVVVNGVDTAIRNEQELAAAVKLVSKAYKAADFGSKQREEAEAQLKRLQAAQAYLKEQYEKTARQEKEAAKQAKENAKEQARAARAAAKEAQALSEQRARAQARADEIASGSIKGLKAELRLLQDEYETLSRAEQQTAGRPLLGRIARIQTELAGYRQEVRDTAREQDVAGGKAAGSYRALNAELVNLRREYKELGRAEREVAGPDLLRRIDLLDTELKELDADMGQYQRNVGNYASAFEGVGAALLDLGGLGDLAGLATPAGAITAAGTAAIATTAYVQELTGEYRALRNEVELLSGAAGDELDALTSRTLAISETFGAGTSELTQAANALAGNIGIGFDEALERIEQGYVAGLDLNGEFLDSLREYPTFFAEAFGPGEEAANAFFEVIRRGNEQGIYNDKAVDTLKEATLSLREMTPAAREALAAIGLNADEVTAQIGSEGIGAAIATVAQRLGELEADSPEVGQAIADIFKGAGEDAGLGFITSLRDIDQATGDLLDTTNDYQREQLETLEVNRRFAEAQGEVAAAFGSTGTTIDNLKTKGQTLLLKFLVPVVTFFGRLFTALQPLSGVLLRFGQDMGLVSTQGDTLNHTLDKFATLLDNTTREVQTIVGWFTAFETGLNGVNDTINNAGKSVNNFFRDLLGINRALEETPSFGGAGAEGEFARAARGVDGLTDAQREGRKAQEEYAKAQDQSAKATAANIVTIESLKRKLESLTQRRDRVAVGSTEFGDLTKQINATQKELDRYTRATKASAVATDKFARDSIGFLQAELADLQTELQNATTPDRERGLLEQIIDVEGAIAKIEEGRTAIRNEIARLGDNLEPVSLIAPSARQLDQLDSLNADILAANEEREKVNTDLTLEERRNLNNRLRENERAAAAQRKQDAIDEADERAAIFAEANETIFGTFFSINSALAEASRSRSEEATKAVQRRYAAEIEAAEGNAARQEQLREEQAEAEARIQAEQLERAKKYQTAAALATAAAGVISILAAPTTIPDPFGAIFKGVQIAALAATTAIQIANIQRQTVAARGLLVEDDDPAMTPPRRRARARQDRRTHRRRELAARGSIIRGWVRGQTHAGPAGGVPLTIHGQRVLVEAGEKMDTDEHGATIIVNKRSAEVNREVLDAIDGRTFRGKRALLHQINTQRAYGRPLMGRPLVGRSPLIAPTFARGGLVSGIPAPAATAPAIAGLQLYNEATVGARDRREPAATEPVTAHLTDTDVARIADAVRRGTAEGAATGAYQGSVEGADAAARARAAAERRNARSGLLRKPTNR